MVPGDEDLAVARKALALGAADYVTKPFGLDYLDAVLTIYLAKSEASDCVAPPATGSATRGTAVAPPARPVDSDAG
jgi:DNA-binding response OmpR family regulator